MRNIFLTSFVMSLLFSIAHSPYLHAGEKNYIEPLTGIEFVRVEGSCFQMGDIFGVGNSEEIPVHEVCLDAFYIGKYEVTIDQYRKFLMAGGDASGVDWADYDRPFEKGGDYPLRHKPFSMDGQQPMIEITWFGADLMAKWLSQKNRKLFRLPTEAEWEYAARSGGKKDKYAGGDNILELAWININSTSWLDNDAIPCTHPVGRKKPNELGLYDMSGNVWEWCQDWYSETYYQNSPSKNPQGPLSGNNRVARGGSWRLRANQACTTYRHSIKPDIANYYTGFRLVLIETPK